jgi:flagellar motor switch/type III secretory pathway protein FliN
MDEKAVLMADVGTGWISRYEFEGLCEGSVIRSTREAGTGCVVRLNGGFFARGSLLVCDGGGNGGVSVFCVSIDGFDEADTTAPWPRRGDRAVELLPFAIRIGSAEFDMKSLEGVALSSIVNLDRPCDTDADAELVLAGVTVAEGKVSVVGEYMALRIVRLLRGLPRGSFPRTTGAVLSAGYRGEPVKDYNFRMPDRFTKRAILRTESIHLDFLRGLQARFPEFAAWRLAIVDQLCYGEWLDDPARPEGCVLSFSGAELSRGYERERGPELPEPFFIESPSAAHPVSEKGIAGLRAWRHSKSETREALPYQIAFDAATAAVLSRDPGFSEGLACLRNGWLDVADPRIGQAAGADSAVVGKAPLLRDETDRWGMILFVRFESADGGRMDIVYPENRIDPFLPVLGR